MVTIGHSEPTVQTSVVDAGATIEIPKQSWRKHLPLMSGAAAVVKVDQTSAAIPGRPSQWNFTITGPNGFNEARSIALGKGAMPSFMRELDKPKLSGVIAHIRTLKK